MVEHAPKTVQFVCVRRVSKENDANVWTHATQTIASIRWPAKMENVFAPKVLAAALAPVQQPHARTMAFATTEERTTSSANVQTDGLARSAMLTSTNAVKHKAFAVMAFALINPDHLNAIASPDSPESYATWMSTNA